MLLCMLYHHHSSMGIIIPLLQAGLLVHLHFSKLACMSVAVYVTSPQVSLPWLYASLISVSSSLISDICSSVSEPCSLSLTEPACEEPACMRGTHASTHVLTATYTRSGIAIRALLGHAQVDAAPCLPHVTASFTGLYWRLHVYCTCVPPTTLGG